MKLGSLFDGSGTFPLVATMCGIEPVWASEVEPYPVAVTRSRFPNMKHIGDVTKVNGADVEPVDVLTFGFPCQDISVAGKREGVKHTDKGDEQTTRSGLFYEAIRIIKEMREATNGIYPRIIIWENVPGLFSSGKGEDFRTVLQEIIQIVEPKAVMPQIFGGGWSYADTYSGNGWSLAYRVLDAQYIRTAQRRRRIFFVADFGGQCASEILFKRNSLRGYSAESRTEREGIAEDVGNSATADDRTGQGFDGYNGDLTGDKSATLGVNCGVSTGRNGVIERSGNRGLDAVTLEPGIARREGGHVYYGVSGTLRANAGDNQMAVAYTLKIRSGKEGGGKGALIQEDKSSTLATNNDQYLFQPVSIENHPADSRVNIDESGKAQTLTSRMGTGGGNVSMVMEQKTIFCLQGNGIDRADTAGFNGKGWKEDVCYTLNTIDRPAVCYTINSKQQSLVTNENKANTLGANDFKEPHTVVYSINHQGGNVEQIIEGKAGTLMAAMNSSGNNKLSVVHPIAIDRAAFNQGKNAKYDIDISDEGKTSPRVARGPSAVAYWDGGSVCGTLTKNNAGGGQRMPDKMNFNCVIEQSPEYIVRRLTPTECARLQGFPDRWGDIENKADLTDEEYAFWKNVRKTHAEINGKAVKDWTKKQMLTWYNNLHSDSSEYKMWGNGIALPCALYVMEGVEDVLRRSKDG